MKITRPPALPATSEARRPPIGGSCGAGARGEPEEDFAASFDRGSHVLAAVGPPKNSMLDGAPSVGVRRAGATLGGDTGAGSAVPADAVAPEAAAAVSSAVVGEYTGETEELCGVPAADGESMPAARAASLVNDTSAPRTSASTGDEVLSAPLNGSVACDTS